MKTLFTLLLMLAPSMVFAQWSWELGLYHQHKFKTFLPAQDWNGNPPSRVVEYLQGYSSLTPTAGVWGFVSIDTGYFSSTLGLYKDFYVLGESSGLEMALAAGTQTIRLGDQMRTDLRLAGTIRLGSLDDDSRFIDLYYESGNGPEIESWHKKWNAGWYQANAAVEGRGVLIGLFSQTGIGHGPRMRLTLPVSQRFDLRPWVAPMTYQDEDNKWQKHIVLGLDLVAHSKK